MIKKYFRKNFFEYDNKIIILSYDKRKLKKYIRKYYTPHYKDLSHISIMYSKTFKTYFLIYDFFNKNTHYRRLTLSFDALSMHCSGEISIENIESF